MAGNVANKQTIRSLRRKAEQISFLNDLTMGTVYSMDDPESPPWFLAGTIHQIDQALYGYHADSEYVQWGDGKKIVYANGREPFQFFWDANDEFFGRQLSEEEANRFCQLIEVQSEAA